MCPLFPHDQIQVKHFGKSEQQVTRVPLSVILWLMWSPPGLSIIMGPFFLVISKLSVGEILWDPLNNLFSSERSSGGFIC